jgi:hypothetical protein
MLGNSLRATGSKSSMNGMRIKTENGIRRRRSVVVRLSCSELVTRRSACLLKFWLARTDQTHLTVLSTGELLPGNQPPKEPRRDPDLFAEQPSPVPVVERLLLDDGPDALHPSPFLLGFLLGRDGSLFLIRDCDLLACISGRGGGRVCLCRRRRRRRRVRREERSRRSEEPELLLAIDAAHGDPGAGRASACERNLVELRRDPRVHKWRRVRRGREER